MTRTRKEWLDNLLDSIESEDWSHGVGGGRWVDRAIGVAQVLATLELRDALIAARCDEATMPSQKGGS